MITDFKDLQLPTGLQRAIDNFGFEIPTEIQARCIPAIRSGGDVIGLSQTGTGKTLAFGIPAIERVLPEPERRGRVMVQVLVLCPTRELCCQVAKEIKSLARHVEGVHVAEIFGGVQIERQISRLKRANIVVGTPGRVMDHLDRKTMKLQELKMIVLDEADEMLNVGFREDIESILTDTPEDKQTVLFSATMSDAILNITGKFQTNPETIAVNAEQITLENTSQFYCNVPAGRKQEALELIVRENDCQRGIIFVNTKKVTEQIATFLEEHGHTAQAIHGDMRQGARNKVMNSFKAGDIKLLVATDVAARGIDVKDIDMVINFDIPQTDEYYVHRIGRTGRAGKSGKAVTICRGGFQENEFLSMAKNTKSEVVKLKLDGFENTDTTYTRDDRDGGRRRTGRGGYGEKFGGSRSRPPLRSSDKSDKPFGKGRPRTDGPKPFGKPKFKSEFKSDDKLDKPAKSFDRDSKPFEKAKPFSDSKPFVKSKPKSDERLDKSGKPYPKAKPKFEGKDGAAKPYGKGKPGGGGKDKSYYANLPKRKPAKD